MVSENDIITVIMGMRNRNDYRFHNCLETLRCQDINGWFYYDVVVVDYGGADPNIEKVVIGFGFSYIYTHELGLFNEARAKNVGVKSSRSKFLFFTNADILLESNAISVALNAMTGDSNSIVLCKRHAIQDGLTDKMDVVDGYDRVLKMSRVDDPTAEGDFQVVTREWFEKARGFDERFEGWGALDNDLTKRAEADGLKKIYIDNETSCIHQNHSVVENKWGYFRKNNEIYTRDMGKVVRNEGGWGIRKLR